MKKRVLVHLLHGLVGGGDLALALVGLGGAVLAVEDRLTELGELHLGDLNVAGVNSDANGGTVGLLAIDLVDVDDPLQAVASGDLALAALVHAALDLDLVVLADGHGTDIVLVAELLGEGSAHEDPADVAGSLEVSATSDATATALDGRHLSFTELATPSPRRKQKGPKSKNKNHNNSGFSPVER